MHVGKMLPVHSDLIQRDCAFDLNDGAYRRAAKLSTYLDIGPHPGCRRADLPVKRSTHRLRATPGTKLPATGMYVLFDRVLPDRITAVAVSCRSRVMIGETHRRSSDR